MPVATGAVGPHRHAAVAVTEHDDHGGDDRDGRQDEEHEKECHGSNATDGAIRPRVAGLPRSVHLLPNAQPAASANANPAAGRFTVVGPSIDCVPTSAPLPS